MSETPTSPNTSRFNSDAMQFRVPRQEAVDAAAREALRYAHSASSPEVNDESEPNILQIGQDIEALRNDALAA